MMPETKIKTQLEGMQKMVELAQFCTEMSAQRTFQTAERTLSVWIRTSLAIMIFGVAIDRLGLMLYDIPHLAHGKGTTLTQPSMIIGAVLVLFSIVMALGSGIRFVMYAKDYKEQHALPAFHGEWPPAIAAFMVAIFGVVLLALMIWIG